MKIGMSHGAGGEVMGNLISQTILNNLSKKSLSIVSFLPSKIKFWAWTDNVFKKFLHESININKFNKNFKI